MSVGQVQRVRSRWRHRSGLVGAPYTFTNAEAAAFVAAMDLVAPTAVKEAIDDFVGALKTAGVWAKRASIFLLANFSEQATRLDLKAPSGTALVDTNSPVFIANEGWHGDDGSNNLSLFLEGAGAGVPWTGFDKTDFSASFYFAGLAAVDVNECGMYENDDSFLGLFGIRARTTGDNVEWFVGTNFGWLTTALNASGAGYWNIERDGTDGNIYHNGSLLANQAGLAVQTYTSTAWEDYLASGLSSASRLQYHSFGGGLTSDQRDAEQAAFEAFLTAIT